MGAALIFVCIMIKTASSHTMTREIWRRFVRWCLFTVVSLELLIGVTAQPTSSSSSEPKYLLIGVSGGLQDGFPERNKMDYVQYDERTNMTTTRTPAIYMGKALIRGYKAFLDVMESGHRQYVDEPNQPLINSNVFASGCYEHANEYWFYMIDERQVLYVLNNEPRFLSITPDTGLIDLQIIQRTSLLPPLIESYQSVHSFIEHFSREIHDQTPDRIIDDRYVAVPLVTAVFFNPSSHVPSPVLHYLRDGTEITNYPDSLAKWANVNSSDRTALYDSGCAVASSMTLATTACTANVIEAARLAEKQFWHGVRLAIRRAELQRLLKQQVWQNIVHPKMFWTNIRHAIEKLFKNMKSESIPSSGLPSFRCRRTTRFGASPNMIRINTPFTMPRITKILSAMEYKIDDATNRIVSLTKKITEPNASSKSEL